MKVTIEVLPKHIDELKKGLDSISAKFHQENHKEYIAISYDEIDDPTDNEVEFLWNFKLEKFIPFTIKTNGQLFKKVFFKRSENDTIFIKCMRYFSSDKCTTSDKFWLEQSELLAQHTLARLLDH